MLKYVAPLHARLRAHVHLPLALPLPPSPDGQRLAERVAAAVGSWRFIGAQAGVMAVWVLINTLALFRVIHFDTYPFVFLNLAMSAEAAFTGPVLLIAANAGALRDHAQYDRIEHLVTQNEQLTERLATLEQSILARLDARLDAQP